VHPFVQVKRDGIGSFHPRELGLNIFCQYGHRADRAIHMEPHIFVTTDIR
jgi:hypothetical protein